MNNKINWICGEIMKFKKELSIVLSDKYHLIGAIYEQELTDLNNKGFDAWNDAREAMYQFGYSQFKPI